jgi:hypothetical protein
MSGYDEGRRYDQFYVMAMDGVVMGCLCGYEQISLQKECTQFPTQSELTIVLIPY